MKVIIIGNGVGGTFAAQNIRRQDKGAKIVLYSKEQYPYYTRIKLPELISEKLTIEDLIIYDKHWHKQKSIDLHLNSTVREIHPEDHQILLEGQDEPVSYDKLVVATGSDPNIPPIRNAKEMQGKGLFTLRNIQDALTIREFINRDGIKEAIIIGGGLLGLELSKQIKACGLNTTVVEFFPRLLPKQLDVDCGGFLRQQIEDMGINVVLDAKTEEILGSDSVEGIKLKNGSHYDANVIMVQAGVHPDIKLAEKAGIETDRGIIVNEYLETSIKNIYAVGDCIQFEGQTWGIIPACIEQSKVIGSSITGKKSEKYDGTVPQNTVRKNLDISGHTRHILGGSLTDDCGKRHMARTDDLCCCGPRLRVGNIAGGVEIGIKPI
ncbi:MAG: NAD(P)/FAD-dependent oxidoreductase [Promethearchaeia archaeon]